MKNKPSYLRQTLILTSRYIKTFFNDRQNLLLAIVLPILTISIVASIASPDMYSSKVRVDHSINNDYPVLAWQNVVQEKADEFTVNEYGIDNVDGKTSAYFIFESNDYKELSDVNISVEDLDGEVIYKTADFTPIKGKDEGLYSVYTDISKDLEKGMNYKLIFSAKVKNADDKNYGTLENEYIMDIGGEFDDVTDKVKNARDNLVDYNKLPDNFKMADYYNNNTQKLLALPDSTMKINDTDYIVINDAPTLAYVLTNKEKEPYNGDNKKWCEYNYYLNCNIDLNNYNKDFIPLGRPDKPYSGIFEGNGYVIKNLKISTSEAAGMFGKASGEIMHLGLEKAEITTSESTAGLFVGEFIENGKLHDCYVKDSTVEATKGYVGALVGRFSDPYDDCVVYSCYANNVSVKTDDQYSGGLVGDLGDGKIKACYSVVNLTDDKKLNNIGYIAGHTNNTNNLENCLYVSTGGDSELKAVGDGSDSDDFKKSGVVSVTKEKLPEAAARLAYNLSEDEEEYGFKKDGQLDYFSETQIALFMIMCVAIFIGICNSIQEICKERDILKREYMTNLKLASYVSSKLIVQAMVCAVQMLLVLGIFGVSVMNKELYDSGVIFGSIWIEFYITLFLLSFAADVLSLLVSAIVKSSSMASTFIPIILIVQVIFTGVLFDVGKLGDAVATIMISKWGMAGLAITSRLNDARMKMLLDTPDLELQLGAKMASIKESYISSAHNLLLVWCVLLVFIVICSILCTVLLTNVKKDRR